MIEIPSNYAQAREGVTILLKALFGKDILRDPNFKDTPRRVVSSLGELSKGRFFDCDIFLKEATFPTSYKGMVIVDPIFVSGLCPHHLLPIEYKIYFGYIPNGKAFGLSKISRVIESLAARPVLQEDLTNDIVEAFKKFRPKGVMTVVKGRHLCMRVRGTKQRESETTTSVVIGAFKDVSTRQEFLKLAGVL